MNKFLKVIPSGYTICIIASILILSKGTLHSNTKLNKGDFKLKSIYEYILFTFLLSWIVSCQNTELLKNPSEKIIIEVSFSRSAYQKPANYILKDVVQIEYNPINRIEYTSQWNSIKAPVSDRKVKWILYSSKPVQMNYGFGKLHIVSPGDSIHIIYDGKENNFSGRGADKLNLWNRLTEVEKNLGNPTKYSFTIKSLHDYLQWNKYVDDKLTLQIPIIDTYRNKIQSFEYEYLMSDIIRSAEEDRIYAFGALKKFIQHDTSSGMQLSDLIAIWDSTQYKHWSKWFRSHSNYYGSMNIFYNLNALEVKRSFGFQSTKDSIVSKELRTFLYYTNAKKNYKGLLRERLLAYILDEPTITEIGVKSPMTQTLLKDYYNQPGFPEYKEWVKGLEKKAEAKYN